MDFTQFATSLPYYNTVSQANITHGYTHWMFQSLYSMPTFMWRDELNTSDWKPQASNLTWVDIAEFYLASVAQQDQAIADELLSQLKANFPEDFAEPEEPVDPVDPPTDPVDPPADPEQQ